MAVNLYSAAPPYGLFNILGKLFNVEKDINTSRGTTIPTDILAAITFFDSITANSALTQAFSTVPGAIPQYQGGPAGCISTLQQAAQNFLIQMVNNDKTQPNSSLKTALQYIITQMIGTVDSINVSAVTCPVTPAGGNTGNGVLLSSTKRGDGLVQENTIAETIAGTFSASGLTASLTLTGQAAASSPLGQDWPLGSGVGSSVSSVDANSSSILTNGGFEVFSQQANVPDNWIAAVATPGTTLIQTVLEVQTLVISGTPAGGTYTISWVNPAGKSQITIPLAFNATQSTVQSALRSLTGLGSVTVVTTGSTPNYTHTITFNGLGGNLAQITATSNLTGGAPVLTPGTTTNGTAQVFAGSYALNFHGNGSELTEIRQLIPQFSLSPNTAYAVSLWGICAAAIAAGVVKIDLYDGSAIINDAQGVANTITFNASALTTSWQHLNALQASECVFRLPAVVPPLVYLRIRVSTALTNTKDMYLDQVGLTQMTMIYPGGPMLALFSGSVGWASADTISVAPANNRAGTVREYCNRNFSMDQLGLLFPTSGSPTIPDAVIS